MINFERLDLPGLVEIVASKFEDRRGYFCEVYKKAAFAEAGFAIDWVQDNQSCSSARGTVRGLHFQVPPFAQNKLVRVIRGAIFDVAVDLRRGPGFGRWIGRELSAENGRQLLVPVGFAHGFMTLAQDTEVLYKVSAPWAPEHERALLWNDPAIAIAWPELGIEATLSDKDRAAPLLAELDAGCMFETDPE